VAAWIATAATFLWQRMRGAIQAAAPKVASRAAGAAGLVLHAVRRALDATAPRVTSRVTKGAAFVGLAMRRAILATPNPTSWPATAGRYLRSRASRIAEGTLLVFAGIAVLAVLGMACNWWRLDIVLSGSMAPTLQPGAVIVAVAEPDSQVSAGQVLAFHPPSDSKIVVVHRVIQVIHHGNEVAIRTQGDDNNAADTWTAVLQGTSAWRVSWAMPGVGYVAIWATQVWLRILALLSLVGILAWVALAHIWREEPQ
jgi:signal peptidase